MSSEKKKLTKEELAMELLIVKAICEKVGYDFDEQVFGQILEKIYQEPTVTKFFVENMTNRMEQMFMQKTKREDREFFIRCEVLRDAGVETEK